MNPTDLSLIHHPVSKLFEWPASHADWEKYRLTDDQIASYHKNGFLAGVKMLDKEQIGVLRDALSELTDLRHPLHKLFYEFHSNESLDSQTVLFHALGAWRIAPPFHDVLWNPRFVMAAYQLLGDEPVRFWHDQLFYKPPKKGGVVAWHQDYSYWTRTKPMSHLTCWCGLDDSTKENGCLQYVPGSHKWGLLKKPELAGSMMGIVDYLTAEQQVQFNPVSVETKEGEAIFHHPLALHGSGENRSNNPRRAFVINVFADGVLSDSNEILLNGVPAIPKGDKMDGQFFPLLYQG